MTFPSAGQLIRHYNVFLLSGPFFLAVSVGLWVQWIRSLGKGRGNAPPARRGRLLLFAVGTLVIGGVHFLGIYASVANAIRFQFDPEKVAELRIVRVTEEGHGVQEVPRSITDRELIVSGLFRLAMSESLGRNHEHFLDGYRIQIVIPGSPARYVSVYRRSSRGVAVAVVIPHLGPGHAGTVENAGEYSGPSFHDWVRKNVDPLFGAH